MQFLKEKTLAEYCLFWPQDRGSQKMVQRRMAQASTTELDFGGPDSADVDKKKLWMRSTQIVES